MKQISTKKIIEYSFDTENEATQYDKYMKNSGWDLESNTHYFIKNYRRYSKIIPQGVFL